jgi:hypothetical protein
METEQLAGTVQHCLDGAERNENITVFDCYCIARKPYKLLVIFGVWLGLLFGMYQALGVLETIYWVSSYMS